MRLVLADRIHTFSSAGDGRYSSLLAGTIAPDGEPAALRVRNGRVEAAGPRSSIETGERPAEIIDLRGATLTPALTDAHLHLLEWALARREVDLTGADSPERAAESVARHARAPSDGWVRGGGWNPHAWHVALPDRAALDRVVPDRPVALRSHDMHALWVNGEALRVAGIDRDTADPPHGRIVRDGSGEPTGVLLEDAMRLVTDRMPDAGDDEAADAVLAAQAELHRFGITGVHSLEMPGERFRSLRLLARLRDEKKLRLRVVQHLPVERLEAAAELGLRSGYGDAVLRIGAVKMFLDGALGSRTAWLREPYEGTDNRGISTLEPDVFRERVRRAAALGLASAVHAIGDAAVVLAIDVLADAAAGGAALPHRIEHVQLCPPDRFDRPARAGVVCSMQPAHLMTDWQAAERHWGRERCRGAYAFRSLFHDGAGVLAFGSDSPVEPVDPRLGLYAAVARRDLGGEPVDGWFADERLTPEEAIWAYTVGPARAGGASDWRGSLAAGRVADFAAWDRDPLSSAPDELLELRCLATAVGGELVWQEEGG